MRSERANFARRSNGVTDDANSAPPTAAGVYLRLLSVAVVVVVLDQTTKQLALEALSDGPIDVIEGVLTLRLTFNSGGAFGIAQGAPNLFLIATGVVMVIILIWARRIEERSWAWPLGLVLGGGLGNVFDRLFRLDGGSVVDFVDLHVWPVFNLADSAIVVGAGLLLWLTARTRPRTESPGP